MSISTRTRPNADISELFDIHVLPSISSKDTFFYPMQWHEMAHLSLAWLEEQFDESTRDLSGRGESIIEEVARQSICIGQSRFSTSEPKAH